jgi:nucleoside-triphosphatase
MPQSLFLQGEPGAGKSTIVRFAVHRYPGVFAGMLTQELREGGTRVGFTTQILGGPEYLLAHVRLCKGPQIGKYFVDRSVIAKAICPALEKAAQTRMPLVIDEIGKMQMLGGERFERALEALGSSGHYLLATIPSEPHPLVQRLISACNAEIWSVTAETRAEMRIRFLDRVENDLRALNAIR